MLRLSTQPHMGHSVWTLCQLRASDWVQKPFSQEIPHKSSQETSGTWVQQCWQLTTGTEPHYQHPPAPHRSPPASSLPTSVGSWLGYSSCFSPMPQRGTAEPPSRTDSLAHY